jgi:hypothetical protein
MRLQTVQIELFKLSNILWNHIHHVGSIELSFLGKTKERITDAASMMRTKRRAKCMGT